VDGPGRIRSAGPSAGGRGRRLGHGPRHGAIDRTRQRRGTMLGLTGPV
jgi:hypothetical protein